MGFPIRRSPGQRPFAPLRSLSQLVASFVAGRCQGIPRVPLFTSNYTFSLRTFTSKALLPLPRRRFQHQKPKNKSRRARKSAPDALALQCFTLKKLLESPYPITCSRMWCRVHRSGEDACISQGIWFD